ncbi:MAG TPA: hypothetical protein H9859_10225 [Candidatus Barnesiella excrementigallinarum]|nr:hypothetical protein [Candidatus Barnesiella excrementigallinarum]
MKTKLFSLFIFTACFCTNVSAVKYFVTPDGSPDNDGLSWETPISLNEILTSTALMEGDEIFVKKGEYIAPEGASFTCNKANVKVYGNCEGTELEKPSYQLDNIETFLKGSGRRVLYFKTASYIAGFDISEGDAYNSTAGASGRAGGVYIDHPEGMIEYCIIHDNFGSKLDEAVKGVGGGVYARGTVKNCIVENNVATATSGKKPGVGGGICLDGGSVINSIIRNNRCIAEDVNNSSTGGNNGGGISIKTGYVVNCLVEGNVIGAIANNANYGGGIDCSMVTEPSTPGIVAHVINCTVVGNDATSGRGGGIGFGNKGSSEVVNCIVVDNMARPEATPAGSNIFLGPESTAEVSYTMWPEAETGTGNLSAAPQFADGSYQLQSSSPAINAGNNAAIAGYEEDLAGKERILDETVDMGAYEYDGVSSSVESSIADSDDWVVETQYYTLSGLRIDEPQATGIYLVKKIFASQRYEVSKVIFVYK